MLQVLPCFNFSRRKKNNKILFKIEPRSHVISQESCHKYVNYDHPGECSPEKDCLWWLWLTFRQPERKPSSESSELWNVSRLPTTTCTIQTTYWQQQRNKQTIDILLTIDPRTFWLTKDGSKRTNHFLQSSQPITSRLTDKRPITSGLRWPIRLTTRDVYTTYWRSTIHLTLKMTSAQVVETSVKVTTNSPSQDYTHPDDHNLRT